jgi:hypothetical protein
MAFSKFANAALVQPIISMSAWDELRLKSASLGSAFDKRSAVATATLQKFDPKQHMLSHCTIIASVDTEAGPGPVGRHFEGGFQVDRRFQDYYITPATSKYVNNNQDSWERKLLLATFRTFVGGQNYVEHLQIPELSKGRIIDAAARDTGDSIYVDILVATDLKHKPLISAIQSGELQTLSMGCTVAHTTCSQCGNVAEDETQLCSHIRYSKGNTFLDGLAKSRKVAELCGHVSDPRSVKFIEASWVANPAFTGAVLRSILTPEELASVGNRVAVAFAMPVPVADPSQMSKAARSNVVGHASGPAVFPRTLLSDDASTDEFEGAGDSSPKKDESNPMDKAVDSLADLIKEKALEKVRGEMSDKDLAPRADLKENQNNTLIKEAVRKSPEWKRLATIVTARTPDRGTARRVLAGLIHFKNDGWNAVREAGFSGREILAISRFLDVFQGTRIAGETRIYRTVLAVGGVLAYGDVDSYLAACRRVVGRDLTTSEVDALITKGKLFDLGAS